MANLKEKYNKELRPVLMEELGIKNIMAVPKLTKLKNRLFFLKLIMTTLTILEAWMFVLILQLIHKNMLKHF